MSNELFLLVPPGQLENTIGLTESGRHATSKNYLQNTNRRTCQPLIPTLYLFINSLLLIEFLYSSLYNISLLTFLVQLKFTIRKCLQIRV